MTAQSPLIEPPPVSVSDSLLLAIFLAAVLHILLVFSINFTVSLPEKINKSIEITITHTPAKKAPKKAQFLAQENQVGAGETDKKPEPPKQQLPSDGASQKKIYKKRINQTEAVRAKKVVTGDKSEIKVKAADQADTKIDKSKPQLSPDALVKQIAKLGANIRYSQQNSEKSRIKFVNRVSTHKYLASQYLLDWQRKVQRTGNLNYPEVARKKNFVGSLVMDVGIKQDGSIYSIRISRSSGNTALDDAAKRIVTMSAPFPPLPKELRKELDVLVITRVWEFSDKSGMSTK
jgi:protein TonB